MRFAKCFCASVVLVSLSIVNLPAQVLFTDGFESYNLGALDKNLVPAGPNFAPNGSGNPWWGPQAQYNVPSMTVVGTEGAVTPHSGTKMVRGASGQNQYISQEWYNAAFRQNAQPYQYFVELDWWFYDPLGSGGVSFMDYMALTYYSLAPSSTDYPAGQDLNPSTTRERLGLGAASFQGVGFDSTKYQARVLGATGDYGSGWFNTSVSRSVGWHHGQIIFGKNKGDGTADVDFRIDGALAFSHSSVQNVGVNSIEMNSNYGDTDGYFDDVRLGVVPEPSTTVLLLCGAAMLLRLRRQR